MGGLNSLSDPEGPSLVDDAGPVSYARASKSSEAGNGGPDEHRGSN